MTTRKLKLGDRVKLIAGAKRVEVNDFYRYPQPFYFELGDVAEVFAIDSPRMRHKPGYPVNQTVLIARVETKDLMPA